MPVITLDFAKLTKEQKTQMVEEMTETASRVTQMPKESIYVFINEFEADNVGVGGKLLTDRQKKRQQNKGF